MQKAFPALILFLAALAAFPTFAQAPAAPAQQPPAAQSQQPPAAKIEAVTEEVVLDIVARDKRGRPVSDLKADEIKVLEDGVEQKVSGFRLIDRRAGTSQADVAGERQIDPLRHLNLVTMVFERLSLEARRMARQGAMDFLKTELRDNVLVAVFTLDQQVAVLQQFTNDHKLLEGAVNRATTQTYGEFIAQSNSIRQQLDQTVRAFRASNPIGATGAPTTPVAVGGRGVRPDPGVGATFSEATLAEITLRILQFSEGLEREQQGRASIYGLLSLVKEQQRLRGRKTLLYFSEGLIVTPSLDEPYRMMMSAANRANVSVYAVDARGLFSQSLTQAGREMMTDVSNSVREGVFQQGAVTRDQVMAPENVEASLRMNTQGTLEDLATSTGGILIANSNDLRVGMRRVAEDIASYYELTYRPPSAVYDGKFRRVTVQVARKDVVLQTRSGYFALPPTDEPMFPYEAPLLAALSSDPLPKAFDYETQVMRFTRTPDAVEHSVAIEVPLSNFTFQSNEKTKTYSTRFSVLAVVKDQQGRIVRKLSENYPLQGPLERVPALKKGVVLFARQLSLPPGRYTLETAAYDTESQKASARRSVLMVPPAPQGVAISSLTIVKRADELKEVPQNATDPFVVGKTRVVPLLAEELPQQSQQGVSFYCVIYPQQGSAEKPQLEIQFLRDGTSIGRAPLDLPAPDAQGRIQYIATIPLQLDPGRYEIKAVVRQGATSAEEHAFFTVAAPSPAQ